MRRYVVSMPFRVEVSASSCTEAREIASAFGAQSAGSLLASLMCLQGATWQDPEGVVGFLIDDTHPTSVGRGRLSYPPDVQEDTLALVGCSLDSEVFDPYE